jgi:hypothetical protein
MNEQRLSIRLAVVLALTVMLTGCAGSLSGDITDKPPTPKVDMNGRWLLAAAGTPPCGMNFSTAPGEPPSGAIAPEGGCPGKFFTSRHWSIEAGGLLITDHNNEPLALLNFVGGRFEGKSASGLQITLSRGGLPAN